MLLSVVHVLVSLSVCAQPFSERLADSARTLILQSVAYDPQYFSISYPDGDVPKDKGVCTDVVIRAYRKVGIDLQVLVHNDMKLNFEKYPKTWGLSKPDRNIDHRRVPNLMTFFSRHGKVKPVSNSADEYLPGDIVCWNLDGNITHIGIVAKDRSPDKTRPLIIHNIGQGQVLEDCLFNFRIIGHFTFK